MLGEEGPTRPMCSKRDCVAEASRSILWRNPKIHPETRTKTWLACERHEEFFLEYLGARNFPVRSDVFVDGD
jgi:hypothetical protein